MIINIDTEQIAYQHDGARRLSQILRILSEHYTDMHDRHQELEMAVKENPARGLDVGAQAPAWPNEGELPRLITH